MLPQLSISEESVLAERWMLYRIAQVLTDVRGDVDDDVLQLTSSWRSDAALSATQDVATLQTLLRKDTGTAEDAMALLLTFAQAVAHARARITVLQQRYDAALADKSTQDGKIPAQLDRFDRDEWRDANQRGFESDVAPLRTRYQGHVEDVETADRLCAAAIDELLETLSPESMRGGAVGALPDIDQGAYADVGLALSLAATRDTPMDADRRDAQWDAFVEAVGRPPESDSEWRTAQMLDETSYQEKNQGVPANVYVGRITPRPGEGTIRVGWFIPAHDVFNIGSNDLGDDRGFDPGFDPEQTRVAVYIDYELGLVIARNNPSVSEDGEVEVGVPDIKVQEHRDGRVRLFYNATNPLAPPGSDFSGHTVHGDVVVGTDGVAGRISDYPSLEAYHDGGDGSTTPLLQDEADGKNFAEELGPLTQLPFMHEVGEHPMEQVNDFYRDDMDGGRHDYEWRNPYLKYPDRYPWSELGSPDDPSDIEAIGE